MKIEDIIYDTTREVSSIEDKLRIATIFLFCRELGNRELSEFLYSKNHSKFIDQLNSKYANYNVDFTINFKNKNVKNAFYTTLNKVIKEWDNNGFLKAISEGDEFALVICEITDTVNNFEVRVNSLTEVKKITKMMAVQLSLFN